MIQANESDVVAGPFPHIVKPNFLNPMFFADLKNQFPEDRLFEQNIGLAGARSGRDIYRGDASMDELLATSVAWKTFHDYINSESFLADTLTLFGQYLTQLDCRVKSNEAVFLDHIEHRDILAKNESGVRVAFEKLHEKITHAHANEIFSRFDIHQGAKAYAKPIHCDRANRLVSLILYFTNPQDIDCEGGELSLHAHKQKKQPKKYERHPSPENTDVLATVQPAENLGVFFLCANNSYHSVSNIERQSGYRNFVYINLSSKASNIWT